MLFINVEIELRGVLEVNALLASALNEYKVRAKNLKKKLDDEKLIEMELL